MAQKVVVLSPEDQYYPNDRLAAWFYALPTLHTLGNIELLRLPLIALSCSCKCLGDATLKAYEMARALRENGTTVIGGFHIPAEMNMLEIFLKGLIVICPTRRVEGMRILKV